MSNSITEKSPAKINLTLNVHGKLDDGYHQISTIMQKIDLCDQLTISLSKKFTIKVSGSTSKGVPEDDTNICYKAFKTLQKKYSLTDEIRIDLEKNIPVGGGMGGGSSNAATTIKILNQLWELGMTKEQMQEIGAKVGMDVPFFFTKGTSLATGRGEILDEIPAFPKSELIIINPDVHVSTKDAYSGLDLAHVGVQNNSQKLALELRSGTQRIERLKSYFHNDFNDSVWRQYPKIQKAIDSIRGMGLDPHMTGSGSCIFVFGDSDDFKMMKKKFKNAIQSLTIND